MSKITVTLIFNMMAALTSFGQTVHLSTDEPSTISAIDGRPITFNTNFQVQSAELLLTDETAASLKLLEKGFVVVPSKAGAYRATIVISARDGAVYTVDFNAGAGDGQAVFKLEDQMQGFSAGEESGNGERYESNEIDQDAKNIVKDVLLGDKMTGFDKTKSPKTVHASQFDMTRSFRHVGAKYIADEWMLSNNSNEAIMFQEEDFYTKGIIAVALEKNRLLPGEKAYMILLVNKTAIYNANKDK